MEIRALSAPAYDAASRPDPARAQASRRDDENPKLRAAFQEFVGQTFYGQMLSAMRKTVGKPAYMHGGRAEEVFQNQLDQVLAEKLSEATAETFAEPMYQLFSLSRR
jgi:Rod binding domain-containing protein